MPTPGTGALHGASHHGQHAAPHAAAFSPAQLLVLQLLSRGYASTQITALTGQTPAALATLLSLAAARLGVSTLQETIAEAKRRGLIV